VLTVDENVKCSAVVVVDEDDACPCGALSRYQVARSDGDESYGINGGSDEACGEHLAETVAGMIDGDAEVAAIVAIRWDEPGTGSGRGDVMFPRDNSSSTPLNDWNW
jgi:hypothetical protein